MDLFAADNSNNNSKGVSYIAGFFMLIGIAMVALVFSAFIFMAVVGLDENAMLNPANANKMRLGQSISVVLGFLVPTLLVAAILNRRPLQLLGFKQPIALKQVAFTIAIIFLSMIIAGSLGVLSKEIPVSNTWKLRFEEWEKNYMEQVAIILDLKSFGGYLLSLLLLAFLPALCEEICFRGGLQNFLTRATNKPWLSILIVSFIFSIVHASFYGFLPRVFLGISLGLIFHYTGSIWLSVLAHFFNNALAVTSAYILTRQGKGLEAALSEDITTAYWGFLAIPVLIILFRMLKKNSDQSYLQTV